jgi:hypothetical protein
MQTEQNKGVETGVDRPWRKDMHGADRSIYADRPILAEERNADRPGKEDI